MKTVRIGIVLLGLFLNGGASAEEQRGNTVWDGFSGFLQPDWERDFSVTLGTKVWLNEWTRNSFFFEIGLAGDVLDEVGFPGGLITTSAIRNAPVTQTSDIEPTPIPQLSLRYKWLLLSGSYYPETDFEYRTTTSATKITQTVDLSPAGLGTLSRTTDLTFFNTTTSEREEWDAGLGILILPNVAILGGYKEVNQDIEGGTSFDFAQNRVTLLTGQPLATSSSDIEIKGPTIGIAGSVPIAHGFGLYGSYAHGFMDVDINDVFTVANGSTTRSETDTDADYDVAEVGFTYTHGTKEFVPFAPLSAATVYAGYRWQHIETDFSDVPNTEDRTDTTRGFVAGVNLSF
ncbi:MAG: hypothetical protein ACREYF_28655 [Gammaproteobacteria bacterium]